MNELQIFQNPSFGNIRAINKDGEPWFGGKDIADALGYKNTKDALLSHVDAEDRCVIQRSEIATFENHLPQSAFPVNFVNGEIPNRGLTFINESGLYSLILRSNMPEAKQFKRWITNEVIPSIRKTGSYKGSLPKFKIPQTFAEALQLAADQTKKLEEQAPKVLFANAVATSKKSILVGELAKLIKQNGVPIGANRLFQWMRDKKYLISRKGTDYNIPTQKSMELGLFEVKETVINHADGSISISKTPKVTGKGQMYFINKFLGKGKSWNVLPITSKRQLQ